MNRITSGTSITAAFVLALAGATTVAQAQQAASMGTGATLTSTHPKRDTANRMMRPITIEFSQTRLEDVMKFLADVTTADIEVMWTDNQNVTGLDKDTEITLTSRGASALAVLEKVLEKAATDSAGTGGNTWQLTPSGTLQVGPKARLNRWKRAEVYPIGDMLLDLPVYNDAPEFDLQAVLQGAQQGGGGGGQSPFQTEQNQDRDTRTQEEKARDLISILTRLVEPEQWADGGGDGGTITFFQGSLLVNAADYMHRELAGYPWWPKSRTRVAMAKGRRYVTLSGDATLGKVDGMINVPVTGAVPGQGGGGGGGGGGNNPPDPLGPG